MVRIAAAFVLSLIATSPAHANDASRLSLARQIVAITHVTGKLKPLLPGLAPTVRQALSSEMVVDPATIGTAIQRVQNPSQDDLDRLAEEIAALYARELTEEDLSGVLAFYRTPSGRNMLAKEAEIGAAIGVLAQHWAIAVANGAVAGAEATVDAAVPAVVPSPSPDPQRWRQKYITAPAKAAVLQKYIDPMDKPEWTALRTVTLAELIADRCTGAKMDQRVLNRYLDETGLGRASIGDLDMMNAVVAPAFSYFDTDRLRLVCAAAEYLFGDAGKLVPSLVSPGVGVPNTWQNGYMTVPPFTGFPHGRG